MEKLTILQVVLSIAINHVRQNSKDKLVVLVYVDDLIITGNNREFATKLKNDL
jgi:hypothetical protein